MLSLLNLVGEEVADVRLCHTNSGSGAGGDRSCQNVDSGHGAIIDHEAHSRHVRVGGEVVTRITFKQADLDFEHVAGRNGGLLRSHPHPDRAQTPDGDYGIITDVGPGEHQ